MGLELSAEPLDEGVVKITAAGELDETNVGQLRAELLDAFAPEPRVLLDLSGLDLIDAAGMALLLLARIELEARGGAFVVHARKLSVRRALARARVKEYVAVMDSPAEALHALRGHTPSRRLTTRSPFSSEATRRPRRSRQVPLPSPPPAG